MQILGIVLMFCSVTALAFNCLPYSRDDYITFNALGYSRHLKDTPDIINQSHSDLKGLEYCYRDGITPHFVYCWGATHFTDSNGWDNNLYTVSNAKVWECGKEFVVSAGAFTGYSTQYENPVIAGVELRASYYGIGGKVICAPGTEKFPPLCAITAMVEYTF